MSNSGYSLTSISKSRNELFGIATLWLVLFHSPGISFDHINGLPKFVISFIECVFASGNIGVDIFLFLSGMGLYYSLNADPKISSFYKRRAKRILPTAMICSALWFGTQGLQGLANYIGHIILIGPFLSGERYFWYFSLLCILYLIYPLVYRFQKSTNRFGLYVCGFLIIWFFLTVILQRIEYYSKIEILINRVPVFLIGCYVGELIYNEKKLNNALVCILCLLIVPSFFLYNTDLPIIFHRYCGEIAAISLIISVSIINCRLKTDSIKRILRGFGKYSMQIYVLYSGLGILLRPVFNVSSRSGLAYYIPVFLLTVILAIGLYNVTETIVSEFFIDQKE